MAGASKNKGRRQNIDPADRILLLEIIKRPQHRNILNNRKTTGYVNKQKNRTWAKISSEFNTVAKIKKTTEQLKSVYRNKLTNIRKTLAKNPAAAARIQTGMNPLLSIDEDASISSVYSSEHTEQYFKELPNEGDPIEDVDIKVEDEDTKLDIADIESIHERFQIHMETPQEDRLKPANAVEEAKIKLFDGYAKALEIKTKSQQQLIAKKIELLNQKILYYQVKRENLEHNLRLD